MATTSRMRAVRDPAPDLSLRQAAMLYDIALRTLRTKICCGELPGYKVRGVRGPEWRVSPLDLDLLGYPRRPAIAVSTRSSSTRVATLERDLAEARRALLAERRRADGADRELGYALLECGRLRTALARLDELLTENAAAS